MFGSSREDWSPDQPDAFAEPLIVIPWVQILELLCRLPEGTTGRLTSNVALDHGTVGAHGTWLA